MSAAIASVAAPVPDAEDFWSQPRSTREIRERLRAALMEELGAGAEQHRLRMLDVYGWDPIRRSPAEVLFLVDALVAQVRREERGRVEALR